jgi:hypothetical protein
MNSRWVRALPLLLSSSVLLIAAAWAFFQGDNNTASIAAFAAGLLLLGSWATTAIVDWWMGDAPTGPEVEQEASSDPDA